MPSASSDVVTWDLALMSGRILTPELGEPKSVKLLSTVERGGMAYSELEFEFEKAGFLGDLYRTPDGKVQEFLLFAK